MFSKRLAPAESSQLRMNNAGKKGENHMGSVLQNKRSHERFLPVGGAAAGSVAHSTLSDLVKVR